MTNVLLGTIAVLLVARFVLGVCRGYRVLEHHYCAPSKVENIVKVVNDADDLFEVKNVIERAAEDGWELVGTQMNKSQQLYVFFTRKRIKTFYEE